MLQQSQIRLWYWSLSKVSPKSLLVGHISGGQKSKSSMTSSSRSSIESGNLVKNITITHKCNRWTTLLSNPMNDSADRWSCISTDCSSLLVCTTDISLFETISNSFLWQCIPWWHQILHHLEDGYLWKWFIFIQGFDA